MMITNNLNHPYWHVRDIVLSNDRIKNLHLSYYKYSPQTVEDYRHEIKLETSEFIDPERIEKLIKNTPEGMEISFHSLIELSQGEFCHLPMVDMSTGSTVQLSKLIPFIGDSLFKEMKWYKSGRSYHGYGGGLICEREWLILMGKLLLANKKDLPPTVDTRWVGHRLIAGYSSLRWSKNTDHYLHPPVPAKLLL